MLSQEITYDLSDVFYTGKKIYFSLPKNWCFPNMFVSLSLKERSLKIRVAEIHGDKKMCSYNLCLTFFCLKMCDMFYEYFIFQ